MHQSMDEHGGVNITFLEQNVSNSSLFNSSTFRSWYSLKPKILLALSVSIYLFNFSMYARTSRANYASASCPEQFVMQLLQHCQTS